MDRIKMFSVLLVSATVIFTLVAKNIFSSSETELQSPPISIPFKVHIPGEEVASVFVINEKYSYRALITIGKHDGGDEMREKIWDIVKQSQRETGSEGINVPIELKLSRFIDGKLEVVYDMQSSNHKGYSHGGAEYSALINSKVIDKGVYVLNIKSPKGINYHDDIPVKIELRKLAAK